jgi:hypothetical protein
MRVCDILDEHERQLVIARTPSKAAGRNRPSSDASVRDAATGSYNESGSGNDDRQAVPPVHLEEKLLSQGFAAGIRVAEVRKPIGGSVFSDDTPSSEIQSVAGTRKEKPAHALLKAFLRNVSNSLDELSVVLPR